MFSSKSRAVASISRIVSGFRKKSPVGASADSTVVLDVQTSLAMKLAVLRANEAIVRESGRQPKTSNAAPFNVDTPHFDALYPDEEIVIRSYELPSVPYLIQSA